MTVERKVAALKVITSTLTTFTEAAFFKRVSGDLDQVAGGKTTGRYTYGCMVNLDESYKFLRMLGLMHERSGASRSAGDSGTVPDAASEFNRLLQTGTASMSTKTSGAFGEGDAPSVSLGIIGNAHPAVVVPMERGDLGVNHAAAKERLLFVTARPIEPHSGLSSRLELPGGVKRWAWPRLLKCAVEADTPSRASWWQRRIQCFSPLPSLLAVQYDNQTCRALYSTAAFVQHRLATISHLRIIGHGVASSPKLFSSTLQLIQRRVH